MGTKQVRAASSGGIRGDTVGKIDGQERDRYPLALELPADLETPAVLVDLNILQGNIDRMQTLAEGAGLALRPHVKTHKSVGSTPTVLAARRFDGLTEIRPGNYVFMDQTPLRLGLIPPSRLALSVLTTVISTNDRYAIVDAGSKTLSSDRGAHGADGLAGFGRAFVLGTANDREASLVVEKLSEEHGFVVSGGRRLNPGDRLQVFPNHACPVVNLARALCVRSGAAIESWTVDAAGCVR